jgi:hypothetical protein
MLTLDIYIEGKLLVELKSDSEDNIKGFFQALHYSKKGLTFSTVCVIAHKFVAVWKVNSIPDFAKRLSAEANADIAPNEIGVKNAKATIKAQRIEILKSAVFKLEAVDLEGLFQKSYDTALNEFVQVLNNLEADRVQINTHNFIDHIAQLEKFFNNPIDAVHCFYAIVGFWDVTSTVALDEQSDTVPRTTGHQKSGNAADSHFYADIVAYSETDVHQFQKNFRHLFQIRNWLHHSWQRILQDCWPLSDFVHNLELSTQRKGQ